MSGGRTVDTELRAEFEAIARAAGCELVHAEWKGNVLRIFLDREGGVSLGDCELVSKQASALLDVVDFGPSRYVLEVSSPGLDRELYGPRDYQRFTGRLTRVTFRGPEGRKRTVVGRLAEFRAGAEQRSGELHLVDERTGERFEIGVDDIQMARLEIEI